MDSQLLRLIRQLNAKSLRITVVHLKWHASTNTAQELSISMSNYITSATTLNEKSLIFSLSNPMNNWQTISPNQSMNGLLPIYASKSWVGNLFHTVFRGSVTYPGYLNLRVTDYIKTEAPQSCHINQFISTAAPLITTASCRSDQSK